jgi:hypothetical protein
MIPGRRPIPITTQILLASVFLLGPSLAVATALATPGIIAGALADDALFFARYASHFLANGTFSFNPGAAPSFGSTSQLYQFIVTAFQAVLGNPAQAVGLAARCSALVAAVLVMNGARQYAVNPDGTAVTAHGTAIVVLIAGVGFVLNPDFASIGRSGMDTATAAAVLALYVSVIDAAVNRGWLICGVLGLGGWVLVLARPELALFAICVPAALAIGDRSLRTPAILGLLSLCVLTGASLVVAWFYYGTPLPLAFYAKSLGLSPYAKGAVAEYGLSNISELYRLIRNNAPLLIPIFAFGRLAFSRRPVWWGLLAGTAAFLFYEAFLNAVPVANGGMRFFLPILPVLVLASAKAASVALVKRSALPVLVACVSLQAAVSVPIYLTDLLRESRAAMAALGTPADARRMLLANWLERQRHKWIGLDRISELEPNCIIATTELGVIGALYPDRPLLDLSGLTNPVLRHGLDRDWLIEQAAPDIIYSDPLVSYWGIDLANDSKFLARYEYFSRSALAGYDSLATRKDSICGRHFAGIIAEERAGWGERWDSNPQPPGPQPGALTN